MELVIHVTWNPIQIQEYNLSPKWSTRIPTLFVADLRNLHTFVTNWKFALEVAVDRQPANNECS